MTKINKTTLTTLHASNKIARLYETARKKTAVSAVLPNGKPLYIHLVTSRLTRCRDDGMRRITLNIRRYVNVAAADTNARRALLMTVAAANVTATICRAQNNRVAGTANVTAKNGLKLWQGVAAQTTGVYSRRRNLAIAAAVRITNAAPLLWDTFDIMTYLARFTADETEVDEIRENAYCAMWSGIAAADIRRAYKAAYAAANAYVYANKRAETFVKSYDLEDDDGGAPYMKLIDCRAATQYAADNAADDNAAAVKLKAAFNRIHAVIIQEGLQEYYDLFSRGVSVRAAADMLKMSKSKSGRIAFKIRHIFSDNISAELLETILKK